MTTQGPRLTFRVLVDTTAELLAPRLRSYRRESKWLVGDVWHELSPIRESEDTHGHTKLLLTEHTDAAGTVYPPSIRYMLDNLQPPQAARVLLTMDSYLHDHAVVSYTYQVFSNLMADYPTAQVEYFVPFALIELAENLHRDYNELIDLVERLGGRQEQSLRHVMGYGSITSILTPDARESDSPVVTWILNTSADTFATWLLASWPESKPIKLDTVTLFLGQLREHPRAGGSPWVHVKPGHPPPARADGPINLVMRGNLGYGDFGEAFTLEQMPDPVIRLALLPLAAERVEARLTWRMDSDGLRAHLVSVLDAIAARWPELRRTIQGPLAPSPQPQTYRDLFNDELRITSITSARDRMLDRIVPEATAQYTVPAIPQPIELDARRAAQIERQLLKGRIFKEKHSRTRRRPEDVRAIMRRAAGTNTHPNPSAQQEPATRIITWGVGKTKQERMEYRRKRVQAGRARVPKMTIEDLAEELGCSEITIKRDMKALGIK